MTDLDQNIFNSYSLLVVKMLEKVKGTDMEPIWTRLNVLMKRLNSLNDVQRAAIQTTMQTLMEKIDHFKNLSQDKLQSDVPNDEASSAIVNKNCNNNNVTRFKQPTRDFRKHKKFKRANAGLIMMSPRRDSVIPKLRIKLSAISQFKSRKEEKRKSKRLKGILMKAETTRDSTDKIPIVNHNTNASEINETVSKSPEKTTDPVSMYDLKDCSIRLEVTNELLKMARGEESESSTLEKIPIQKSQSRIADDKDIEMIESCPQERTVTDAIDREIIVNLRTVNDLPKTNVSSRHKNSEDPLPSTSKKSNSSQQSSNEAVSNLLNCLLQSYSSSSTSTQLSEKKSALTNNQNKNVKILERTRMKKANQTSENNADKQEASLVIKKEPGLQTPPMTEIPMDYLMRNCNKDKKLVLLSAEFTLKKIRPWIQKSTHRKFLKNCEEMLASGFCLTALFKCMGSTCSYYTRNSQFFLKHLERHKKYQNNDIKNFSCCPYCQFSNGNSQLLTDHINNTHGSDRYQCSYCFYRSYDFQIHTHHKLFHPLKSESVIECSPVKSINMNEELSKVWKNLFTVCRPIICCVCKGKFYNINHYENHFQAYKSVPNTKCIKCASIVTQETTIDHLKGCHGFGDYNCAFCSFGSDSLDSIKIHLSNNHFDKPMLYFDRSLELNDYNSPEINSTDKNNISKILILKQLVQQKPPSMKILKIFNTESELENYNNINGGIIYTNN